MVANFSPILRCLVLAIVSAGSVSFLTAAEPGANPGVPELKVLERFVGKWEASLGNSSEVLYSERKWVLDGRFLKHEFDFESGDISGVIIRGFDEQKQRYTMSMFTSSGHASHLVGQWSAEQKTLTFEARDSSSMVQKYESYFPDDKTEKWTLSFGNPGSGGEISGTAKRVD